MFGCGVHRRKTVKDDENDKRFKNSQKILLLGIGESGKTTIIKQMKILHLKGFSTEEKQAFIPFIKQNIHESICDILYNMDRINPAVQLADPENHPRKEYILKLGPGVPKDDLHVYYDYVKKLWKDEGVQKAFRRSNEYQLIDCAEHFLDRVGEVEQTDYFPTIEDILFCRIKTTSVTEIEFTIPVSKIYGGGSSRFLMYDVGGQRGERKKWIQVFDGIQAVLFIISSSDFDQTLREDPSENRLVEAFKVFGDVYCSRFLRKAGFIVFLNKQDLLKKKINEGRKLEDYFPDYRNYIPPNNGLKDEYNRARSYMKQKILDATKVQVKIANYNPITDKIEDKILSPREVFIHYTIATDTNNVKKVFESVHETIIKNVTENVTKLNSLF